MYYVINKLLHVKSQIVFIHSFLIPYSSVARRLARSRYGIKNSWIKTISGSNCTFQLHADSKIQSSTDKCVFRLRQSNVRRLLPAFGCCRARDNQIVVRSSDNEQSSAVVVSWEDPPNTWLTAAKNAFVGWAFNSRVRVLLKRAVTCNNLYVSQC